MESCIFCKIVKGEIPCYNIYEDEDVFVFLDAFPCVKGQTLVVPKKHSRWLWDMPEKEYLGLMEKVYYLAGVLRKAFDVEWVEEVVAGIGVEHTHVHLLPRREDDGLGEVPTKPLDPKPSEKEMKKIAEKIRAALGVGV